MTNRRNRRTAGDQTVNRKSRANDNRNESNDYANDAEESENLDEIEEFIDDDDDVEDAEDGDGEKKYEEDVDYKSEKKRRNSYIDQNQSRQNPEEGRIKRSRRKISDKESDQKTGNDGNGKKAAIGCISLIVCAIICFGVFSSNNSASENMTREEKIKNQFSSWDGSHRGLVAHVKESMNDPKSFEHIETRFTDKGNYLQIVMKFRGKNAYGALIIQEVHAEADIDGRPELIEIIKWGP